MLSLSTFLFSMVHAGDSADGPARAVLALLRLVPVWLSMAGFERSLNPTTLDTGIGILLVSDMQAYFLADGGHLGPTCSAAGSHCLAGMFRTFAQSTRTYVLQLQASSNVGEDVKSEQRTEWKLIIGGVL